MCASYDPLSVCMEMYPLNFVKPGIVFIFNNMTFGHRSLSFRAGSDKDVQRLFDTFGELNFDVECYIDKTAKELRTCISKIIREVDFTNIDSVLMFIMSHGRDNKIFGTDGEELYLSEFVEPLKSVNSLKNKPKIFFINACRGNMMAPTHDSYTPQAMVEMDAQEGAHNLNAAVSKTPLDADILLAFSTVANYFSIRNSENGSWYIQILCDMIDKFKTTNHLVDILTCVNAGVARKEDSFENRHGQNQNVKMMSTYTSQLKKNFYLTRPSSHVKLDISLTF